MRANGSATAPTSTRNQTDPPSAVTAGRKLDGQLAPRVEGVAVLDERSDEAVEVARQRPRCPGIEVFAGVPDEIRCLQRDPVDTSYAGHDGGFIVVAGVDAQPARALIGEVERKKRLARPWTQLVKFVEP